MPLSVLVRAGVAVSVTVMDWVPALLRAAVNVCAPAVGRGEGVLAREVQGRRAGRGVVAVHRPQEARHGAAQGIDGGDGDRHVAAGRGGDANGQPRDEWRT